MLANINVNETTKLKNSKEQRNLNDYMFNKTKVG